MSNSEPDPSEIGPDFSIEEDDSIPDLPAPSELPVIQLATLPASEAPSDESAESVLRSLRYGRPAIDPDRKLELRTIEWNYKEHVPGSLELVELVNDSVVKTWEAPGRGIISWGVAKYTYGGRQFTEDGEYFLVAMRGNPSNDDNEETPNRVRIQIHSRASGWEVVGQVDFPDPTHGRNMDAFFESTGNPDVLAFKIEGNWQTTLHWVTWPEGNLNVSPPIVTEDPIPFSFGPVFSPDLKQYLIGNASFDFGVTSYSWPDCKKIGLAEWPKTVDAIYLDRRWAVVRVERGKLLLLDTLELKFKQEWVISANEMKSAFDEYYEKEVLRNGLVDIFRFSPRLLRATFDSSCAAGVAHHVYIDVDGYIPSS